MTYVIIFVLKTLITDYRQQFYMKEIINEKISLTGTSLFSKVIVVNNHEVLLLSI